MADKGQNNMIEDNNTSVSMTMTELLAIYAVIGEIPAEILAKSLEDISDKTGIDITILVKAFISGAKKIKLFVVTQEESIN